MIIDLHTHTTYSDGKYSISELLENAAKNNIRMLAITDHDAIGAHINLASTKENEQYNVKIIAGTELSAIYQDAKIELLGYNFDLNIMDEWLKARYNSQLRFDNYEKELEQLINGCHRNGINIDSEIEINWEEKRPIGIIREQIKKYTENRAKFTDEEWENYEAFYRSCTSNKNFILYFSLADSIPTAKECSDIVRKAGGKVFLAHLYKYKLENYIEFLDSIVKEGLIDGVEVYYPKFSDEQIDILEKYCEEHELLMSGGTDFHGKPDDTSETDSWVKLKKLRMKEENVLRWLNQ